MRMLIAPPQHWTIDHFADSSIVSRVDGAAWLICGPLRASASPSWHELGGVSGEVLEVVNVAPPGRTRGGWPMQVCLLRAGTELRLAAAYRIDAWFGAIVARARDAAAFASLRHSLVELLAAAEPHLWSDQPACVAELWDPGLA